MVRGVKKRCMALLAGAVLPMLLAFCNGGGGDSSDGGSPVAADSWVYLSGSRKCNPETLKLSKGGTGTCGGKISFAWKIEDKRFGKLLRIKRFRKLLRIIGFGVDYGPKLILVYNGNDSAVFVRKADYEYARRVEKILGEMAEIKRLDGLRRSAQKGKAERRKKFKTISDYVTDSRDGQKYRTVKIGDKTWMAENLNYRPGNSWCPVGCNSRCYDNDNSFCKAYGRLYDWHTAKAACLSGWHLPSREEWNELGRAVGGVGEPKYKGKINWIYASTKLKTSTGWDFDYVPVGTDEYGFSALPGGSGGALGYYYDHISDVGESGFWWTAADEDADDAYLRKMAYDNEDMREFIRDKNLEGFSVRCVRDG